MEGQSDLKKARIQGKREQALEALYVFRCNAFIDWMQQANEEDKQWAKQAFECDNKPSWEWHVRSADCVELVNGIGSVYLKFQRDTSPLNQHVDVFPLLRYMWSRDDSAARFLSKNILTLIYGVLHCPADMRSFSMVNRRFHSAAVEYQGYDVLIQRLLKRGQVEKVCLFKTPHVAPHRRFFALCFISCMSDDALSDCLFQEMRHGNHELVLYVHNLNANRLRPGGVLEKQTIPRHDDQDAHLLTYVHPDSPDEFVQHDGRYFWGGGGPVGQLIMDEEAFYFSTYHRYTELPLALMRDNVRRILFSNDLYLHTFWIRKYPREEEYY